MPASPFKQPQLPILVAHRGGAGLYLENSLPAFENAIKTGCGAIECDIQLTRDNALVIYHDFEINASYTKLDSVEGRSTSISTLTQRDLQTCTLIDPMHGLHSMLPQLHDLLTLASISARRPLLFLEIKTSPLLHGIEVCEKIVDLIIAEVKALYDLGRITLLSFDWRNFAYARRVYPEIASTFVYSLETHNRQHPYNPWFGPYEAESTALMPSLKKFGADMVSVPHEMVTDEFVDAALREGLLINAWTTNTQKEIQTLYDHGVHFITTDFPNIPLMT
jgi:glycerophosphoryl diester phosphodiesterase